MSAHRRALDHLHLDYGSIGAQFAAAELVFRPECPPDIRFKNMISSCLCLAAILAFILFFYLKQEIFGAVVFAAFGLGLAIAGARWHLK